MSQDPFENTPSEKSTEELTAEAFEQRQSKDLTEALQRPKVMICCRQRALANKIAERLIREKFDVLLHYEESKEFLGECQAMIVEVGKDRENVPLIPFKKSSMKESLQTNPLVIALLENGDVIESMQGLLQIDRVFNLPLDLSVFTEVLKNLLRERGIAIARMHERMPVNLGIILRAVPSTQHRLLRATNVSMGGFFAEIPKSSAQEIVPRTTMDIGKQVTFVLHPGNRLHGPVKGTGVIRWIRSTSDEDSFFGIGVKFSSLFNLSDRQLEDFIHLYKTTKPKWI